MSILGVTGCAGLIIGAFTLMNMIGGISDQVYGQTYLYDQKVVLNSKADSRFIDNKKLDGIVEKIEESATEIICPDGARVMKLMTILPPKSSLVDLKDENGNPVTLPNTGITVTRKLATTLNLKVGDKIEIKRADKSYVSVPIGQIVYMAAGQGMYMTDTYFESLGETFKPSAILVKWNHQPDMNFLKGDYVAEYVNRVDQASDINSNTKVVYIAAVMLIIIGAVLAFVVLYNCSILNFAERIRDLSTLRVLGFYQKEIRSLVLTENFLSVFLGIIFGIPVGKAIADIVASGLDNRLDLIGSVTFLSVIISGIITLIFALVINKMVAKKMSNIDMLQSLKSAE